MEAESNNLKQEYISLNKASKLCKYSRDYLSLRARQGKLKAVKYGNRWVTTEKWLNNYIHQFKSEAKKLTSKDLNTSNEYISLFEASKLCKYSQQYLSLRARQGKLKAVKRGHQWVTTKEWLRDYIKQIESFGIIEPITPSAPCPAPRPISRPTPIPQSVVQSVKLKKSDRPVVRRGVFSQYPKLVLASYLILVLSIISIFNFDQTVEHTPAGILDSLSQSNQRILKKVSFFSQRIRSSLINFSLELGEILVPKYSLIEPNLLLWPRRVVNIIQPTTETEIIIQKDLIAREITKQIVQEKTKITETEKVTEVTRTTETIQDADLTQINQDLASLSQRLSSLSNQIVSKIDYTTPSYAPVYIPASGIQVGGHALLSSLNVSDSGAFGGSLSVRKNVSFGDSRDSLTTMDVYSDATFYNPVNFDQGLTATGLTANTLSITGNGTIGGTFSAATTTLSNLTVTGNATTTGSHYVGGDLTVDGTFNQSGGANSYATTTITGDLTVQDSDGMAHFYVQNNSGNLGIGTTSPEALLNVVSGANGTVVAKSIVKSPLASTEKVE